MTVATTALHPQRLALRLSLATPIADLEPAIGVFHRCLQRGWLEGAHHFVQQDRDVRSAHAAPPAARAARWAAWCMPAA